MARHPIQRKHLNNLEPFHDSILVQKMANQLMKKGKKMLAQKILKQTIREIEKRTHQGNIIAHEHGGYKLGGFSG